MNAPSKTTAPTILLVDDTPENLDVLSDVLSPHYQIKVATNGEKALRIMAGEHKPDLVLLDIMMPGISGYEVCQRLKRNTDTRGVPVIFVTAMGEMEDEKKGLELGAVDYITKPISPAIVLARVRTHLALYDQTRELERLVDQRTAELQTTRLQIIRRLGRAAEFKDNETGNHVIRMSHYARLTALAMGMSEARADLLFHAAPMHDVGKIGIPDHILLKPGKLDAAEWEVMRQHPQMGADIIGQHRDELLQAAHSVALTHHEKWDGSGYPHGLRGEEIPVFGRIVAIADVFDALTTARPYKTAWSVDDAVAHIAASAGQHFDPALLAPFQAALPQMLDIRARYAEENGALTDLDLAD
ncbi:two-component system response regulator [Curvibacter sp. APW13]|uniref:response regulator n=1 Tax=Curvibacter sp. APW13 TaxID=3077236 RepID=UPI0028DEE64C|nr:two-component system response regulator [Curvibacter sp. APW13]MDT8991393.1 two-component system response regulator [Curvibacter sp. APW13]